MLTLNTVVPRVQVANEMVEPGSVDVAKKVPAGMWALYNALKSNGLEKKIKVKTPQHPGFLTTSSPPSAAECNSVVKGPFSDLLNFLQSTGEPRVTLGHASSLYSTADPTGAATGVTWIVCLAPMTVPATARTMALRSAR